VKAYPPYDIIDWYIGGENLKKKQLLLINEFLLGQSQIGSAFLFGYLQQIGRYQF
jgi:hypothetical protein